VRVRFAAGADAVALVKPQFELGLPRPPVDEARLSEAVTRASDAFSRERWRVVRSIESRVRGAHGAIEFFVHAIHGVSRDRAASRGPPSRGPSRS
jgi:predicted rRNA methylase YqxC with S4 and FtsJ domains